MRLWQPRKDWLASTEKWIRTSDLAAKELIRASGVEKPVIIRASKNCIWAEGY